jgi:hypothetical protein
MGAAPRIWALLDDRPGDRSQVLGVLEALGLPFEQRHLGFALPARLPNVLLGATLRGLDRASRACLVPPWPDLVVAAGRRSAPVARWLKRQQPATFFVQLMWPGSARGLDLIAVPEHDRTVAGATIVRTIGAPHRLDRARLDAAALAFRQEVGDLPRPWITCLVGGSSRHGAVGVEAIRAFARAALALAEARGGSLLVTTSRRTGPAAEAALAEALAVRPHFLHCYGRGGANPYPGLLGVADAVVVTGDSASMMTEATATGRPSFVFDLRPPPDKLGRLVARLRELGHLRPLGAAWPETVPPPLLPQITVAQAIVERWPAAAKAGAGVRAALQEEPTSSRAEAEWPSRPAADC